MGQDLSKIKRVYDRIAVEYAQAFTGEHEKKPKDREVLQRFSREIGKRKPVWDLGCGPGQTVRYLKDMGVEISGLDLSEKLLDQAKAANPGVTFRKGNILELDLSDASVAGAVAFYAIVHFTREQVKKAFCEVFRVLQPKGLFLLTYHIGDRTIPVEEFQGRKISIDFFFFPSEFISRCLREGGFEGVEIIEREPYPDIEYESRRGYAFARKPPGRH